MTFLDLNTERSYTISAIKADWAKMSQEEPWNYDEDFRTWFFTFLMDTINDRNDLEIIGPTPREVSNIIIKLRDIVL